eukprot:m51a1_g12253 hypothetical protein (781) ;mRNA; f:157958-160590
MTEVEPEEEQPKGSFPEIEEQQQQQQQSPKQSPRSATSSSSSPSASPAHSHSHSRPRVHSSASPGPCVPAASSASSPSSSAGAAEAAAGAKREAALSAQVEDLRAQNARLEAEAAQLRANSRASDSTVRAELDKAQAELRAAREREAKVTAGNAILRAECDKESAKVAKERDIAFAAKERVVELEESLEAAAKRVAELEAALAAKTSAPAKEDAGRGAGAAAELQGAVEAANKRIAELEGALSAARAAAARSPRGEKDPRGEQSARASSLLQKAALCKRVRLLEEQLRSAKKEPEHAKVAVAAVASAATAAGAAEEVLRLREELRAAQETAARHKAEAQQALEASGKAKSEAQQALETASKAKAEAQQASEASSKAKSDLQKTRDALDGTKSELQRALQAAEASKTAAALTHDAASAAKADRSKAQEVEKLKAELQKAKEELQKAEEQRASAAGSSQAEEHLQFFKEVMLVFLAGKFEDNGRPLVATVLASQLIKESNTGKPLELSKEIFAYAKRTNTSNFRGLVYWLATAWWLLQELTPQLSSSHDDDSDAEDVIVEPDEDPDGDEPGDVIIHELRVFLFQVFKRALEHSYETLEGMLHVIVDQDPSNNSRPSGPVSIIAALSEVSQTLKNCKIPQSLRLQYFTQVCYFISSTVFNMVTSQRQFCSCGTGLQIKMNLSYIEDWFGRDKEIVPATKQFNVLREVSNLLVVMDKTILLDEGLTKQMFPSINPVQLDYLIESCHPDELSKQAADPAVIQSVKRRAESCDLPLELDARAIIDV